MSGLAINVKNDTGSIIGVIDLFKEEDIKINYQLSDIRNPESRKISFTQEFTIPGTRNNNTILMPFFDNGYSVTKFNPLKRLQAQVSNGEVVFEGSLQLTEVIENEGNIEYKIIIYDKLVDFFSDLGDDSLKGTIDLSEYNHILTTDAVKKSWTNQIFYNPTPYESGSVGAFQKTTIGKGYVYPLEDRGTATKLSTFSGPVWETRDFRPAIYVKTFVDKVFAKYGWTYKSEFFNSDYFKHLIIPFSADKFVSADQTTFFDGKEVVGITDSEFFAGWYGYSGLEMLKVTNTKTETTQESGLFKEDYNTKIKDPGNVYNVTSDVFTVAKTGNYRVATGDRYFLELKLPYTFEYQLRFVNDSNGNPQYPYIYTEILDISVSPNKVLASRTDMFDCSLTDGNTDTQWYYRDVDLTYTGQLTQGHQIIVRSKAVVPGGQYKKNLFGQKSTNIFWTKGDIFGSYSPGGNNGTITIQYDSRNDVNGGNDTTYFNATMIDREVGYGDIVPMNNAIPDIKMKDLFTSLSKLFNLYWEPTDKYKELRIEPYEDFYSNNNSLFPIQDWTPLVDQKSDITITPVYELTGNEYLFTYKDDSDYLNKRYKDQNSDIFGEKKVIVDTDFINETVTIQPIFSPTPMADFTYAANDNPSGTMILPSYCTMDENGKKSGMKPNFRLLYWGGLLPSPSWNMVALDYTNSSNVPIWKTGADISKNMTTYPYAGHLDNPTTPTIDLNYGLTKEYYNTWTTVTNNNLFNRYWRNYVHSIIDVDANMVSCKVHLTELDMANFNLKNTYQYNGVHYKVNKLVYSPAERMADVELIRKFDYQPFKASVGLYTGGGITSPNTGGGATPWTKPDRPNIWLPDSGYLPSVVEPWTGTHFGTWDVGFQEPVYNGSINLYSSWTSVLSNSTHDTLPLYSARNITNDQNTYRKSNLIQLTGAYNQVADPEGPVLINGDFNRVMGSVGNVSILGSKNTVAAGVRNTTVIGDSQYVTESDATYNNGIITKAGIQRSRIDLIRGGIDEIQNPFNRHKLVNIVRGGIDENRALGTQSPEEFIKGDTHIDNPLANYNQIRNY